MFVSVAIMNNGDEIMGWKFWKKDDKDTDETTIKVTTGVGPGAVNTEIYVNAQTSKKALKLYKKLKEEGK